MTHKEKSILFASKNIKPVDPNMVLKPGMFIGFEDATDDDFADWDNDGELLKLLKPMDIDDDLLLRLEVRADLLKEDHYDDESLMDTARLLNEVQNLLYKIQCNFRVIRDRG